MSVILGVKNPNVAIIVGTYRELTLKQIAHLGKIGVEKRIPGSKSPDHIDLFTFHLDIERDLITQDFISFLENYDVLIMSGGATAGYILEKSGFRYITNLQQYSPLISLGQVTGGILDKKLIILKGGLIGEISCYHDILKWIGCLYE